MSEINKDTYVETIKTFLFDPNLSQALLIDGDWGCGKSFFVNNTLIPELEKIAIDSDDATKTDNIESKEDDKEKYNVIPVSLFGMSEVKEISNALVQKNIVKTGLSMLTNKTKEKDKNNDKVKDKGKKKKLWQKINKEKLKESAPDAVRDLIEAFSDSILVKAASPVVTNIMMPDKDNTIIIFDDFERCRINIIELMGFINNLCENEKYKIIIIANEKEINYGENNSPEGGNENSKSNSDPYMRTREKLIGHTIHLVLGIKSAYDDILKKYVKTPSVKELLTEQKDLVCECFESKWHHNLRTLISVFKCSEYIFEKLKDFQAPDKPKNVEDDEVLQNVKEVKEGLLRYICYSAISRSDVRNSKVAEKSLYATMKENTDKSIIQFSFIDIYWNALVLQEETINEQFQKELTSQLELLSKTKDDEHHKDLALFHLRSWTNLTDSELYRYLDELKEELKNREYYVQEYKDIVQILISISDMTTGLLLEDKESFSPSTNWKAIDIEEYLNLMSLDDKNGEELTREALLNNVIFDQSNNDQNQYYKTIKPLLDKISKKGLEKDHTHGLFDDDGKHIFEYFGENRDYYYSEKKFLSLYSTEEILTTLSTGNVSLIQALAHLIKLVYVSDASYCYHEDLITLEYIKKDVMEDRLSGGKKYNKDMSRTVAIALCSLESALFNAIHVQKNLENIEPAFY